MARNTFVWSPLRAGGIYGLGRVYRGLGCQTGTPATTSAWVTSADGTSARTVHLTLSKAPGQVLVQRYWPYDGSTFEFLTGENEVVDQIILPEIADLLPERLFKYRARYTSSTSAPGGSTQRRARHYRFGVGRLDFDPALRGTRNFA